MKEPLIGLVTPDEYLSNISRGHRSIDPEDVVRFLRHLLDRVRVLENIPAPYADLVITGPNGKEAVLTAAEVTEVRTALARFRGRCEECGDSGWKLSTGDPQNGWNRNAQRCSRGCPSKCGVCGNDNCDNPNGQH
jgi:hypothetical protein